MAGVDGMAVLVTGAANAVGRAIAEQLADHGAKVLIVDIDDAHGTAAVQGISAKGGTAAYLHTDVTDEQQVIPAVDEVVRRYGRIDGLVNNAGGEVVTPVIDATTDQFRTLLDTNLIGVFLCLKYAALAMRRQGDGGAIVNVSSVTSGLTAAMNNGTPARRHPSVSHPGPPDAATGGAWHGRALPPDPAARYMVASTVVLDGGFTSQ